MHDQTLQSAANCRWIAEMKHRSKNLHTGCPVAARRQRWSNLALSSDPASIGCLNFTRNSWMADAEVDVRVNDVTVYVSRLVLLRSGCARAQACGITRAVCPSQSSNPHSRALPRSIQLQRGCLCVLCLCCRAACGTSAGYSGAHCLISRPDLVVSELARYFRRDEAVRHHAEPCWESVWDAEERGRMTARMDVHAAEIVYERMFQRERNVAMVRPVDERRWPARGSGMRAQGILQVNEMANRHTTRDGAN